ncbi:hypothetical protein [Chondromyces apiculatus]|uniref:hypothetical protein n=1 Tax=Chondromyces apiculatus TaxID=51 RepID=UPI0012DCEA9C|nr:hypothetical protein [Chondromyces apiculatus]
MRVLETSLVLLSFLGVLQGCASEDVDPSAENPDGSTSTESGSGSDPGGSDPGGSEPERLRQLLVRDIPARDVIADPDRGVFYATVGGDAAEYANKLVVIEASTAQVTGSVYVGSQPLTMALSDDASTL